MGPRESLCRGKRHRGAVLSWRLKASATILISNASCTFFGSNTQRPATRGFLEPSGISSNVLVILKPAPHLLYIIIIYYYYYYFIQIPMIKLEINQTPAFVHVPSPCHCPSPFLILLICVNASICMPGWSFPNHYSTCSLIPSATWIAVEEDKTHTHTHPCSQPQRLRYACVPRPNLVRRQQHEPRP